MISSYEEEKEYEIKPSKSKAGKAGITGAKKSDYKKLYFSRLANKSYIKEAHAKTRSQAIFKVTSYAKGARVKNLIAYLVRKGEEKKQAAVEDSNGVFYDAKNADEEIYKDWKKDFDRKKPGSKRNTRHAVHLVFSSANKNTPKNARKTLLAAKKTAAEIFKDDYKYAVVMHENTKHPHAHVIVNMKSQNQEKKKLKINKPEIFGIRQKFAENLNKLDLYHSATLKQDRPAFVAKVAKDQVAVIENKDWFASKLKTASIADNVGSGSTEDNIEKKKNVSKAICYARRDLKKDSGLNSKSIKALRDLERSLINRKSKNDTRFKSEIDKTIKLIGQDAHRFLKYLNNFKTAETGKKKKNSYAVMKMMRKNIYSSIELAESQIVRIWSYKEKFETLEVLKLHKKLMQGKIKLKEVDTIKKDFERSVLRFRKTSKEFVEKQKQKDISVGKKFLQKEEFAQIQNEHFRDVNNFKREIIISSAQKQDKMKALNLITNYQKTFDKKLGVGMRLS